MAGQIRDPVRLRRYLEVLGLSTAGLPTEATIYQAAGVDKRTAAAYERLLQSLYVLDNVPAWSSNRIARLVKRSKRYLVDPALAERSPDDSHAVLRDGDMLGRVLDTFVAAQLRPEVALVPRALVPRALVPRARSTNYVPSPDSTRSTWSWTWAPVASSASKSSHFGPGPRDARHLAWMRDELGEGFVRGIVLHTGPRPFELDDRLWALPICALWAGITAQNEEPA
ncbi:MAG: DUF4143 domain-containing protein [Pseudonocardia sp.]